LGLQVGKRTAQRRCPQDGLIAAVEEETPEAEVQFGDDLAGRLGLAFAADAVPRGRDIGMSACVEHPGWVVIPVAWAAGGGVPGRELVVQHVA